MFDLIFPVMKTKTHVLWFSLCVWQTVIHACSPTVQSVSAPKATDGESEPRASPAAPAQDDLNATGAVLEPCSTHPLTGFHRDGYCRTGPSDRGTHVICAQVTERFLRFTAGMGNDLQTPSPRHRFPGLSPGDRWCLCALRWKEAQQAQVAPPVILESTERTALRFITLPELRKHSADHSK